MAIYAATMSSNWKDWQRVVATPKATTIRGSSAATTTFTRSGWTVYDRRRHVCCNNVIQPISRPCCRKYSFLKQTCCKNTLYPRPLYNACCGNAAYNKTSKICCKGVLMTRYNYGTACCGARSYDSNMYICCRGVLHRLSPTTVCCEPITFKFNTHKCCPNLVVRLRNARCWTPIPQSTRRH